MTGGWWAEPTLQLVNLDRPSRAFVLAPAAPVALGFIRDSADVFHSVDIEYIFRTHLNAGSTTRTQVLVYNYSPVHCNSSFLKTS